MTLPPMLSLNASKQSQSRREGLFIYDIGDFPNFNFSNFIFTEVRSLRLGYCTEAELRRIVLLLPNLQDISDQFGWSIGHIRDIK